MTCRQRQLCNKPFDGDRANQLLLSLTTMTSTPASTGEHQQTALDRDALALQAAVADLVRIYQFRDRDRICCHDVSVTQCYALETLVQHGPMRLSELSDRLFLDKSTTSRVVSALVRKRYVTQRADANDARATTLSATQQGRRLYGRITNDLVLQQKELLKDLDPEVRSGVVQVLRRLAQAADARFRSGISVGPGAACCPVDTQSCG